MTDRRVQLWILGAIMAGAAGLHGCNTEEEENHHCWNADGDATCQRMFGTQKMYCTTDAEPCGVRAELGCVAERPALDECYSPCGNGQSLLTDAGCLLGDEGDDSDGSDETDLHDVPPECGNGRVELDEECDDGNRTADDSCTNACTLPVCGDGIVQAQLGEVCDDGNTLSGDGCTASCRRPGAMIAERVTDEFWTAHAVVIDSQSDVTVLAKIFGGSSLLRFDGDLGAKWTTKILRSEFPNLSLGADESLLVCGIDEHRAATQKIDPYFGAEIWQHRIEQKPSSCKAVASSDGYLVSAGYGNVTDKTGVLVRHNRNSGAVLETVDWNHGPLGPVAVDGFGRVWAIGHSGKPELRIYSPTNTIEQLHILDRGVYIDMIVDAGRNVYLLARSADGTSFRLTKIRFDGDRVWKTETYEGASAHGMALLANGSVVVAGHTSDKASGLLAWYDQASGGLVHDLVVGSDEIGYQVFHDVAVAPSGEFGVAVGSSGKTINSSAAWIYQFEN